MAISPEFISAVQDHDLLRTRIMLKDSMLMDLTMRDFEERLAYAESKLSDLYEDYDGGPLPNDISVWNRELLDDQVVALINNFSKQRVSFLKKLVRHVFSTNAQEADRAQVVESHSQKSSIGPKEVGVGIAACGAVVAVVGLATVNPPVAVAGVAVAAVGSVIVIRNK